MADKADMIVNADRPVAQESAEFDNYVELILPEIRETIVMDEAVAAALCSDIMRIVTGISADEVPENNEYR